MRMRRGAALGVLLLAACARPAGSGDGGAGPDAAVTASAPDAAASTDPPADAQSSARDGGPRRKAHPGDAMEARRRAVARAQAEPVLAANLPLLQKQFGGVMPASIGLQLTELTDDKRRAALVYAERKDGSPENPLVMVVDEANAVRWSRERPTAGIQAPVTSIALAGGPEGRFAIAVCDPPTSRVALRLWDEDGSPFADFAALETKTCDALSLLYWPTHGYVIVAAGPTETRAQLITDGGNVAWGPEGKVLGARWRTTAPATLAADTPSSFVLVQYSQSPGEDRDVDHALAFRYDDAGAALWPQPVDLGAARRVLAGHERILVTRPERGALRVVLAGGEVELRPSGEHRRIP
ncbi:MAG: hypothetical protein JWP97_6652 [Labilithrix sp.]|nr:hypothetical protein [Labilithrix sp.]